MSRPNRYLVRLVDREDQSSLEEYLFKTRKDAEEFYNQMIDYINPVTCYVTLEDLW